MPTINVTVRDKIAQTQGAPEIVCGNSDFAVLFDFDAEWSEYDAKTARFVWCDLRSGKIVHADVLFTGNVVAVPVLYSTAAVAVGLYAGDIHTTTPARIPCARCITDGTPQHEDPPPDVYEQILDYLKDIAKEPASTPTTVRFRMSEPMTEGFFETFVMPVSLMMMGSPEDDPEEPQEDQEETEER